MDHANTRELAHRTVNRIEEIAGKHPGYRRAHAKGSVCEGTFKPTGEVSHLTTAPHLRDEEVNVLTRFSNVSPNPKTPDILSVVKGMSVQFQSTSKEITNLVTVTIPLFVTKSPETFLEILKTVTSFKKGKPQLKDMVKLFTSYPEGRKAFQMIRKLKHVKSYATGYYYAIHAFYLINKEGIRTPVKFEWEPEAGVETLSVKEMVGLSNDYLEKELHQRLENEEVKFRLYIIIGEPGDVTDDPTQLWPKERKRLNAGVLTVKKMITADNDLIFDPTVLTKGIECSDDPILLFRKHAYADSYDRRKVGE